MELVLCGECASSLKGGCELRFDGDGKMHSRESCDTGLACRQSFKHLQDDDGDIATSLDPMLISARIDRQENNTHIHPRLELDVTNHCGTTR